MYSTDRAIMADVIPRQIANAHTFFNVSLAALLLPVTRLVSSLIDRLMPEKPVPEGILLQTRYLDKNLLSTPALGLSVAKEEALRIARTTQDMVGDVLLPFLTKDRAVIDEVLEKEKLVDFLCDRVNEYLTNIIRQSIDSDRAQEAFQIMYSMKEMEQIADTCVNLLEQKAGPWIAGRVSFSDEGKKELIEYHTKIQKQLARAIEVFQDLNLEKARLMKEKHKRYRHLAADLEKLHYERLRDAGKELEMRGDTHLELMTHLRTMMSHATNIARILIKWGKNKDAAENELS